MMIGEVDDFTILCEVRREKKFLSLNYYFLTIDDDPISYFFSMIVIALKGHTPSFFYRSCIVSMALPTQRPNIRPHHPLRFII